ncbi:hypothetical protein Q9295_10170 [Xinfangfangia sp. CPCC 101601]|uniref:Portal protein n=1 Tax=Pseudogemmobacter lacusdianii TaxID=3069608 RepID=A0ABU0VYN4_9RHOB|nr:hypothetical protein [Xinfangfangia sp. CPCC 101601]MDQ2066743.1 hypothetical protein [Xinfangfangia sp. CPCC 101601]
MDDEKIVTILQKAISDSEHITDGRLSRERQEVERYYRGELPAPLHAGDSKYVSRDVFDAVDSMRSTVLEAFLAHSRIVNFSPEKGETVDDAKQATDYCRHVLFKENDGEQLLYDVLTDGLMKRFSIVKVFGEELTDDHTYEFEALTEDELTAAVADYPSYEFNEAEVTPEGLFSGSFIVTNRKRRVVCEVVQPEDILISSRTTKLCDAKYLIHRMTKSKSELLKAGLDKSKVEELTFSASFDIDKNYEKQSRFEVVDDMFSNNDAYQGAVEEVTVYEAYIDLDMEGEGKTQLWKITMSQDVVLHKEQVKRKPFAVFVPLPVPHTFFGENFGKAVIPVQNARTVLIRQIINHALITNNPRQMVMTGTVANASELVENRIGGIVNVRRMDGIAPIPQGQLNPYVFSLISMIDEDKEEVTGISKLSQGMNKDAISTQNSQGMVEQLISQSQQRQKIVARRFGKFVRELFGLIYDTVIDFVEEAEYLDVTGNYVPVKPADWIERSAASIELSLGYGDQQREAMKWTEIDQYFRTDPQLAPAYDYTKRYEVLRRGLELRGVEDIESFLTPPDKLPPAQPSPAEQLQMEQMKSQIEYQKAQAQAMIMKGESDRMLAQAALIKAQADASHKQADSVIEAKRVENEIHIGREELRIAETVPDKKATFAPDI